MKKCILFGLIILSQIMFSCEEEKKSSDTKENVASNKAFPNAIGCGMNVTGGRGGRVYRVTTLEDEDLVSKKAVVGSLRWALEQSGPKIIVFAVSGTIKLQDRLSIPANTTVFGQSAPGDGICISGESLGEGASTVKASDHMVDISGDNVIVQFIRFRFANTNFDADCFNCIGHNNIMIDHCSFSWSTDECVTCYGNTNFTMQWCMAYEGLNTDSKGNHGFGGIWGGSNASFHHNLIANQSNRNPRFDHDYVNSTTRGPLDFVNNVIYVVSGETYGGESCNSTGSYRTINMVNNYYKFKSGNGYILNPTKSCDNCTEKMKCSTIVPGKFYIAGNYIEGQSSKTADNWTAVKNSSGVKSDTPFNMSQEIAKQAAEDAYVSVLAHAGVSHRRDAADVRVVNDVVNNTGSTVSGNSDISMPVLNSETALADMDRDGLPDEWEDANGLDKTNWEDSKSISPNGYAYIEEYMQSLVKDLY